MALTSDTRMVITRQDRLVYYQPTPIQREELLGTAAGVSHIPSKGKYSRKDTDAYALAKGLVSITPLSLDLTSRNCLDKIAAVIQFKFIKRGRLNDRDSS